MTAKGNYCIQHPDKLVSDSKKHNWKDKNTGSGPFNNNMISTFSRQTTSNRSFFFRKNIETYYQIASKEHEGLLLNKDGINIKCGQQQFSIEQASNISGQEKYQVRNAGSGKIVAEIKIIDWYYNPFWEDIPSTPHAEIMIGENLYYFRNISKQNFLKSFLKNKLRIFDFKFYKKQGDAFVNYQVKMDIPAWTSAGYFYKASFTGCMETNIADSLPSLIGLFLVEKAFEEESRKLSE